VASDMSNSTQCTHITVDQDKTPPIDDPLFLAIKSGDRNEVFNLLNQGRDPNWFNKYPPNTGLPATVRLNGKWVEGGKLEAPLDSPLHIAARLGQHDIAKMLLTRGVDVLRVDGYSSTPLYYVVCNKDKNMALLLLQAGADQEFKKTICRRGVAHTSVLETAIMNKNLDMTRLLLGHGATSKLHPKPKRRAVRGCLHNGLSALYTAVTYSTPAIAKLLLERGARVNAVTWRSETPFHAVVSLNPLGCNAKLHRARIPYRAIRRTLGHCSSYHGGSNKSFLLARFLSIT